MSNLDKDLETFEGGKYKGNEDFKAVCGEVVAILRLWTFGKDILKFLLSEFKEEARK